MVRGLPFENLWSIPKYTKSTNSHGGVSCWRKEGAENKRPHKYTNVHYADVHYTYVHYTNVHYADVHYTENERPRKYIGKDTGK